MEDFVTLGRWWISPPQEQPDENGTRVLISMKSLGPLEIWEWGFLPENQPFMRYAWLENDFYTDDNRTEYISMETLLEKISAFAEKLREYDYPETAKTYDALYEELGGNAL